MKSVSTILLPISTQLPTSARKLSTFSEIKNILLSIQTIVDADCEVHLGLKFIKIYKDNKLILQGDCDKISRMKSVSTILLPILTQLPTSARKLSTFSEMKNILLSIPTIVDADCEVHLGLKFIKIYKDNKLILEGDCDKISQMWTIYLVVPTTTTTTTTTTNLEKLVAKSVRWNSEQNELSKSDLLVRTSTCTGTGTGNKKCQTELSRTLSNRTGTGIISEKCQTELSLTLSNFGKGKALNNLIRACHKNKVSQYQKNCACQHDTAHQHDTLKNSDTSKNGPAPLIKQKPISKKVSTPVTLPKSALSLLSQNNVLHNSSNNNNNNNNNEQPRS